jgi:hypothetical protein
MSKLYVKEIESCITAQSLTKDTKHSVRGNQYLKNYQFDYNFGPPWGACSVTFTAVAGHVMDEDFPESFGWGKCEPGALFDAPIVRRVHEVSLLERLLGKLMSLIVVETRGNGE